MLVKYVNLDCAYTLFRVPLLIKFLVIVIKCLIELLTWGFLYQPPRTNWADVKKVQTVLSQGIDQRLSAPLPYFIDNWSRVLVTTIF